VAVLLQPFDRFLLTGNVVLGLGDVAIRLCQVLSFEQKVIVHAGMVARGPTEGASTC
jgi:hypothetical protein